jgi:hypothetical protein
MADDIAVTPGSGATIAADEISSVKYQRVKLIHGADGVNAGDVATGNPLPVTLANSGTLATVTTVGTVSAVTALGTITPGTAASSLGKAEDAAHTSGDVGVMALGVQKATPADISTEGDYTPFQVDSGQVWVKLGTALPAGTAAIGKLAANSGVVIGDVNVVAMTVGTTASSLCKAEDAAHASGDTGVAVWAVQKATPADVSTDGDYAPFQVSGGGLWVRPASSIVRVATSITRPSNTTQYAINDIWAATTEAVGGSTFTGAARVSGGGGVITDAIITSSVTGALQGEVLLFNQAITEIADNAVCVFSDADILNMVGKISFTLETAGANNSFYHAQNLGLCFVCTGTANLRYVIRVKNTYTPASGEVLNVALKIKQDG